MMTMTPAVAPLAVTLFGPMQVSVEGHPLTHLRSRKSLWLLALLALRHGRPVEREWLAETLWPDAGTDQSLTSLRTVLCELRQALGREGGRLQSPNRHSLCLELGGMSIDLLEFDAAKGSRDEGALKQVVALYRGPLLEGCTEEWVTQERLAREQDCLRALRALADAAHAAGDLETATGYHRRAVGLNPWRESAQRGLMQALCDSGDSNAALDVYHALTRLLRKDNPRAAPDEKTTALYSSLRAEARRRASQSPRPAAEARTAPVFESDPALAVTGYLPHALTDLIGREKESEAAVERLRRFRLVTLTGPGGIGKTRLALSVAAKVASEYADGVWLVSLDSLSEGRQVVPQIVLALGLKEGPERSAAQILTGFLRQKRLLLVLDNCEHLLEASAQTAALLLRECADVRILATSREALGITGEAAWAVPGLTVPCVTVPGLAVPCVTAPGLAVPPPFALRPPPPALPHLLADCESVQLFVERAQAVNPSFALTESSAPAVAQVCARLEGIPLAIELAAARVRVLTVEQVAARLNDYLSLLTGGSRAALPRQQTLRATLDWSYDLLSRPSRLLLARLSVFAGGWTLEAVEEVGAGGEIAAVQILDLLTGLVEKSLVTLVPAGKETRYRFLETVRQYAVERLAESGETDAVRDRHLSWCVALAEDVELRIMGPEQAALLTRLETEHDNLRAGLAWGEASPAGAEQTLRLAGALGEFWFVRGYWAEQQRHLTAALAREGAQNSTVAWAKALHSLSRLAHFRNDFEAMRSFSEQLLVVSRETGHYAGESEALTNFGYVKLEQGDLEAARSYFEQALAISREIENPFCETRSLNGLGHIKLQRGDFEAASLCYEQALAIRRELSNHDDMAHSFVFLANVKGAQGDWEAARFLYEQALAIRREIGSPMGETSSLRDLAHLACTQNNWGAAVLLHEQARAIHHRLGDQNRELYDLLCLGTLAGLLRDWEKARLLLKEALTVSRETGSVEMEALCLNRLAEAARSQGALTEARALLVQSLTLHGKFNKSKITINTLVERAALALAEGDAPVAARLLGTVEAALESGLATLKPEQKETHRQTLAAARAALGDPGFTAAWDAGRAMTLDEAVQYALEKV